MENENKPERYTIEWERFRPALPQVRLVDKDKVHPHAPRTAVAVFESELNRITIKRDYDCLGVRIHEYVHWLNYSIFKMVDEAWEVLWWHLNLRSWFVREPRTGGWIAWSAKDKQALILRKGMCRKCGRNVGILGPMTLRERIVESLNLYDYPANK